MSGDSDDNHLDSGRGGGKGQDENQNNTIIQQINAFSLIPMNEQLAKQTIEDHKYLLELIDNRAAIAFFAASNRNQALYEALVEYYKPPEGEDKTEWREQHKQPKITTHQEKLMCEQFYKMIDLFDFMSLVMYPDLNNRREFIHDCWIIA